MTPTELSDDAIRAMFERRAARSQPQDLRDVIVASTAARRQMPAWAPRWPSGGRLLIAAALTTALVGALAATGGTPRPSPDPSCLERHEVTRLRTTTARSTD